MRRILFLLCVLAVAFQSQASRPSYRTSESLAHFTWGIEAGGAIDMTSHDMSTVDINAYFGYRNSWINMLGLGASINMMVDNSSRAFPVYFMFQSSFRQKPSLAFFDFRTGVSFNNTQYDKQQTDFYLSRRRLQSGPRQKLQVVSDAQLCLQWIQIISARRPPREYQRSQHGVSAHRHQFLSSIQHIYSQHYDKSQDNKHQSSSHAFLCHGTFRRYGREGKS